MQEGADDMTDEEAGERPWQLTIRIPKYLESRFRRMAKQRTVPPAVLIRQLAVERMELVERERERADG